MSNNVQSCPADGSCERNLKYLYLAAAFALLGVILAIPTPEGLTVAGHRMLGILVFSVVIWMSEAVSYPTSAAVIMSLMAFLVGLAPNVASPDKLLGTSKALEMALAGFNNSALALVGGALFLAAAMTRPV